MIKEHDYIFKCVCIGDGGCGKTAMVVRFSQDIFKEKYHLTIGVEFAIKTFNLDGKNVKLQIWDTGGQERFDTMRTAYYRGAAGAVVMFDLTNRSSFDHLPKWIEEVTDSEGDIPMIIVGNKNDLVNERVISYEEAKSFADTFNVFYIESSAKNDIHVNDAFTILSHVMIGIEVPNKYLMNPSIPNIENVDYSTHYPTQIEIEESIPVISPRRIRSNDTICIYHTINLKKKIRNQSLNLFINSIEDSNIKNRIGR